MMSMLSPDLLDRRALGAVQLVDVFGAPVRSRVQVRSDDMRIFAKNAGLFLILGAADFASHEAAFATPPATPAVRSKRLSIEIEPDDRAFAPRRAEIRLPRDPDASHADNLFAPIAVMLLPSVDATIPATAAAVRVTVTKQGDGRRVGGALVRVASDNGLFAGHGVTDVAGEALIIVPQFPMTHVGNNASVTDGLAAKVTVVADPAKATLTPDANLRTTVFATLPDPDTLAADFPPPGGGSAVRLSVRETARIALTWVAP